MFPRYFLHARLRITVPAHHCLDRRSARIGRVCARGDRRGLPDAGHTHDRRGYRYAHCRHCGAAALRRHHAHQHCHDGAVSPHAAALLVHAFMHAGGCCARCAAIRDVSRVSVCFAVGGRDRAVSLSRSFRTRRMGIRVASSCRIRRRFCLARRPVGRHRQHRRPAAADVFVFAGRGSHGLRASA